ncbi:MAG: hypothetical protein Q8R39_00230 [bacterium]|nr:hypothetical protein [bacterium]MDZ4284296.1 hypothetical protein [Patescibacteria group bacterium]
MNKKIPIVLAIALCAVSVLGTATFFVLGGSRGPKPAPNGVTQPPWLLELERIPDGFVAEPKGHGVQAYPLIPEDTEDYQRYYSDRSQEAGVTWLPHPELVGDLGLITHSSYRDDYFANTKQLYYRIGRDGDQDIVATTLGCEGPCLGDDRILFVGNTTGYRAIALHSSYVPDGKGSVGLSGLIVVDNKTIYQALAAPEEITLMGERYVRLGFGQTFFAQYKFPYASESERPVGFSDSLVFETESDLGPVFRRTRVIDEEVYVQESYVVRLPGGLAVEYGARPIFVTDDRVPAVVWLDGSRNKEAYRGDGTGGCGGFGAVSVAAAGTVSDTQLKIAGVTNDGRTVYDFKDVRHPIPAAYYAASGGARYVYDEKAGTGVSAPFTLEEFVANHGVFLYKNGFGRYIIFSSVSYGPAVECAKPVIYLYPEKETAVRVRVGADIRESDPPYNDGWSVVAAPDGALVHEGAEYPSLFWDGLGRGEFPSISSGFVVAREEVEATLRDHLGKLGLIGREVDDFLDFWLPLMPTTPLTRLTWLGTRDMDKLAALDVVPAPDTSIRVFLVFEGLSERQEIPPQVLRAPRRTGFTLVEWGGLLRQQPKN